MDALADLSCNLVTAFVNGVSACDPVASAWGGIPDGATAHVNLNDILGNSAYGIQSGGGATLDAENDWRGAASGPEGPGTT